MADPGIPGNGVQPAAPVPVPVSANIKRDATIVLIATFLSVVVAVLVYQYLLRPPEIDWAKISSKDIVELVINDSYWFHELYMRWTAVDWFLTFLATGTALSAVIKNSVSVKSGAAADLSKWDLLLIIFALFSVLGTTFDGKIHAGQLADKYRAGDLILQEAKIDYAASKKDDAARDDLKKRWHDAQSVLESPVVVKTTAPPAGVDGSTGTKTDSLKSQKSDTTTTTDTSKPQQKSADEPTKPIPPVKLPQ